MTASVVSHGAGCTIGVGDAQGGPYTTILEVKTITGPGREVEMIDVTHMQSPAPSWDSPNAVTHRVFKEYLEGLKNGGDVTVTFNFLPAAGAGKHYTSGYLLQGQKKWFLITYHDDTVGAPPHTLDTTDEFQGLIKSISFDTNHPDALQGQMVIQVSGKPTNVGWTQA